MNSSDTLLERAKRGDKTVLALSPLLPQTSKQASSSSSSSSKSKANRLPRVDDFAGVAEKHSIKNMMLHDPSTSDILLVMGKKNQFEFRLIVTHPFTPVTAFATAVASCESSVRPQAQI